ncbi:hypothetical protein NBRC111894_3876 [Sporolactobacillus inulinus]|uniref:Plasmid pRiA4b Orf3-like domain-containing protein n=1 Tax=Sporolactobacillus inulinus TaxID=2078 RepID=A0A4Y1ZGL0_9BACL|nr:plasmid pRiA4b ORF-3 family protein [Sporolactobacillus inulinus]GAY78322.1 hypothetical protein NBRC111894_3876 [Sporolactobacillus inulinus]
MIYQLKIVLKEYDQLLWIRLQLDETVTFATLYDAICYAFDLSAQGAHHFVLSPADAPDRSLLQCEHQCRLSDCLSDSRGFRGRLFYQDELQNMKFNLFVEQIIPPQKGLNTQCVPRFLSISVPTLRIISHGFMIPMKKILFKSMSRYARVQNSPRV